MSGGFSFPRSTSVSPAYPSLARFAKVSRISSCLARSTNGVVVGGAGCPPPNAEEKAKGDALVPFGLWVSSLSVNEFSADFCFSAGCLASCFAVADPVEFAAGRPKTLGLGLADDAAANGRYERQKQIG